MATNVITRDAYDLACQILGVPTDAPLSAAKEARNALVRRWHSDAGATDSEENRRKIGEAQEAFNVIRDCNGIRPAYVPPPMSGADFFRNGGGGPTTDDFDYVFAGMFGGSRRRGPFPGGIRNPGPPPTPPDIQVEISLLEVIQGGQRMIQVPTYIPCPKPGSGRHSLTCVCHGSNMAYDGFQSLNVNIPPGCGLGISGPTPTRLRFAGKGKPTPAGERADFLLEVTWDRKPIPIQVGTETINLGFSRQAAALVLEGEVRLDLIQVLLGGSWTIQLPWDPDVPMHHPFPAPGDLDLENGEFPHIDLLQGRPPLRIARPKGPVLLICTSLDIPVLLRTSRVPFTVRERILLGLLARERGLPLPEGLPDLPDVDRVLAEGLPERAPRRKRGAGKRKGGRGPTGASAESA